MQSPAIARFGGARPPRAHRSKVALVEMFVALVIVGVLTGIAAAIYQTVQRRAADEVARADLRNAVMVLEQCDSQDPNFPLGAITVTGPGSMSPCQGQLMVLSAGTTLTYLPALGGFSYVLLARNSSGGSRSSCFNSAAGGAIRSVARDATTC